GRPDDIIRLVSEGLSCTGRAPWLLGAIEDTLGASLRDILRSQFFSFHLSAYSRSRRRAPIYWQLATTSASYSVWLYIHAFTKDTLFRVQNEYVAPKL